MSAAVVLLSGGIDSAACVAYMQSVAAVLEAVFVDYLQPARESERESATRIAQHYKIPLQVVQATATPPEAGEIAGRNAFLVLSALMLRPHFKGLVTLGIHAGTPYYDCSEVFTTDMQRILDGYSNGKIQLSAPFLSWTKGQILDFCRAKAVPMQLTWSCETTSHIPCGQCLSCKDRALMNASAAH